MTSVHTTGLNWESLGVILSFVTACFMLMGWYLNRRNTEQKEQVQATQTAISTAVNGLRDTLILKLETKEAVNALRLKMTEDMGAMRVEIERLKNAGNP